MCVSALRPFPLLFFLFLCATRHSHSTRNTVALDRALAQQLGGESNQLAVVLFVTHIGSSTYRHISGPTYTYTFDIYVYLTAGAQAAEVVVS